MRIVSRIVVNILCAFFYCTVGKPERYLFLYVPRLVREALHDPWLILNQFSRNRRRNVYAHLVYLSNLSYSLFAKPFFVLRHGDDVLSGGESRGIVRTFLQDIFSSLFCVWRFLWVWMRTFLLSDVSFQLERTLVARWLWHGYMSCTNLITHHIRYQSDKTYLLVKVACSANTNGRLLGLVADIPCVASAMLRSLHSYMVYTNRRIRNYSFCLCRMRIMGEFVCT